jgi:two-component system response regulator CpxR
MAKVLVIDDDPGLGLLLKEYLVGRGLEVELANDGPSGLARLGRGDVELVVLDVMMPGMDGFEVLKTIRSRGRIPVVMLTARGDDFDRIVGLELGADDYLPKPFNPRELLARIQAVLRRSRGGGSEPESAWVEASGIRMDPHKRETIVDGVAVELTTTEFDLLWALVSAAGRVIQREKLMELARGQEWAAFERSVDVHISHIRRKIGDDPKQAQRLKTIRGVGYLVPRS